MHQSEGLRRDGAWEHAVLQQRAAGAAPLDEAADVCVLMHVSVPQANTGMQQHQALCVLHARQEPTRTAMVSNPM